VADSSSLADIHQKIREIAKRIGAPADLLPHKSEPNFSEGYWIRAAERAGGFELLYCERGLSRLIGQSRNADEIVEQVFGSVTFSMASSEEVTNRRPGEDFRIQLWEIQDRLMDSIDPAWVENLHKRRAQRGPQFVKDRLVVK
jgi:hypothetical protein